MGNSNHFESKGPPGSVLDEWASTSCIACTRQQSLLKLAHYRPYPGRIGCRRAQKHERQEGQCGGSCETYFTQAVEYNPRPCRSLPLRYSERENSFYSFLA